MTTCDRPTQSGAGFSHVCEREAGHSGAHYSNPHGIPTMGLSWTHENWQGHAVFPGTPGATDVTNDVISRYNVLDRAFARHGLTR